MKYTRWFGARRKPGKNMIGVYPTRFRGYCGSKEFDEGYSWWGGSAWINQQSNPVAAEREREFVRGATQRKEWRGLTTKDGK